MSREQRDLLLSEREMTGLPYTTTKQSIFTAMDDTPWNGCMSRCYFYLSFNVGVATAETREIPIAELDEALPYSRRQIYKAMKALKDSGAIIEHDKKANRYILPHVATTAERRALAKQKEKGSGKGTRSKSSTGVPPQAFQRPNMASRAGGQASNNGTRFQPAQRSESTKNIFDVLRDAVNGNPIQTPNTSNAEEELSSPADNSEDSHPDDGFPF